MIGQRKIRVLVAKVGLDGHDVGAKTVVRAMMDAGFDVTYTGLRKSPEQIASQALDIDADVVGLSILSGVHLPVCRRFAELRKRRSLEHVLWVVGGVIPDQDRAVLTALGVDAVFPVGTPLDAIIRFIRERLP